MNLGQLKAKCRVLASSPAATRWTESTLAMLANDAANQLSLDVDFPQATYAFDIPVPPVAPTAAVVGVPGTTQYLYAAVVLRAATDAPLTETAPGPPVAIANGNATLDDSNYNDVTFTLVPGTVYAAIRQVGNGPMQLLATGTASGTTATLHDKGQYVPQPYRAARGNEFQVPEWVKVLRVYMATPGGAMQPLIPTDISTLGGDVDETFNQNSTWTLGNPPYTPTWIAQGGASYPVASPGGYGTNGIPYPVSIPWGNTSGRQRPMYYMRGGFLGVLPPSIGPGMTIVFDYIPKPPLLSQNADELLFPESFKDALTYKMLEYMMLSDDSSKDDEYATRYQNEVRKLRSWNDYQQGNKPHSVVPLTKRAQTRSWPVGW